MAFNEKQNKVILDKGYNQEQIIAFRSQNVSNYLSALTNRCLDITIGQNPEKGFQFEVAVNAVGSNIPAKTLGEMFLSTFEGVEVGAVLDFDPNFFLETERGGLTPEQLAIVLADCDESKFKLSAKDMMENLDNPFHDATIATLSEIKKFFVSMFEVLNPQANLDDVLSIGDMVLLTCEHNEVSYPVSFQDLVTVCDDDLAEIVRDVKAITQTGQDKDRTIN